VGAQKLPEPLPPHLDHPDRVVGQVSDELAHTPVGERTAQLLRARSGRRNDERLVVTADPAGTATRPPRVQAGQADLVEPVDHPPHGVLIGLHQRGDRGHGGATGRRHDDQGAANPDPVVFAAPHDLLELAAFRIRQPPCPYLLCHRHPQARR
jgi:hypothetical protein